MKRGRLKQSSDPVVSEKRLKLANKQSKQESKTKAESKAKVTKIKIKKEEDEEAPVYVGTRDIFMESIEKHYYKKYEIQKRGKSQYRDTRERVAAVKRIEQALVEGVDQIVTLEFFNFTDLLGPGTSEHVDADVEIIIFDDKDRLLSNVPVFRGKISTASTPKSGANVVYFPISQEVDKRAENVYVFCTVRNVPVNDTRDRKRGMRSSRSSSKENLEFKTFYGVRKIMMRRDDELEMKSPNASIILDHMDGPSNVGSIIKNNNWKSDSELLNKFYSATANANVRSSLPAVTFEISDEHIEEDWNDIELDLKTRFKDFVRSPSEDFVVKFVEDLVGSPEKENGDPEGVFEDPGRFLLGMSSYTCPVSIKTFINVEDLVSYMSMVCNRLEFRIVSPRIIAVSESNKTAPVVFETVIERKAKAPKMTKREPGIIPYLSMPFANIIKEPIKLYPGEQFVMHRSSSDWYAENTHRRIWEFIDATDKEKKFMEQFDVFFSQKSNYPPVSRNMKRLQIAKFVEANSEWLKKERLISLMTTFLNQCFTADIISADDMYELLLSLAE
ncbi:unnamed protein product [Auanema sp. JU1783]|nr:unnamed protein product [Auanema sp. JU1783]